MAAFVIHTNLRTSIEVEKQIAQTYQCLKCRSNKLRPIAFVRGVDCSVFYFQCISCYEDAIFVFTNRTVTNNNVIINIVNSLSNINEQIKSERMGGQCPLCKKGVNQATTVAKCNRMTLDILECNSCHSSIAVVSIVRNTLLAYSYNIQLGRKVANDFPEIAMVFCVSALETYFRQLFEYHSELNKYLVEQRKVNFQSLDDARIILQKEFSLDVLGLIGNTSWNILKQSFRKRHFIIHNASHDNGGKKIVLSHDEIKELFSIVEDLVYKCERALFDKNIVI